VSESDRFDVVVVGGGPGGSTIGTLVAQAGHRVLLLEREKFPRYQIGESLLPSTVHGVCAMLGVSDELREANFPTKNGGNFRWGTNPEAWKLRFALSPRLAGPNSFAYQVERARFDQILLDNARKHGVEVREEHQATELIRDDDGRITGVRYRSSHGSEGTAGAAYVAIAGGNTDSLARSVGKRIFSERFRNIALFGYYDGGSRLPAPDQGNILVAAFPGGWFWYIPLSDTLTSVGAVVTREHAAIIQRDREEAMAVFIASCPLIASQLADAKRVTTGMYGQLRVRKDYSYMSTNLWRPGVVLVGDAACFIDPVLSTGVHLATYGAVLAARSINTCLAGELPEKTSFEEFDQRYRREFEVFRQFLSALYNMEQDESAYFGTARSILGMSGPDDEAFTALAAGAIAPEPHLFGDTALPPADRRLASGLERASRKEMLDEGQISLDPELMGPLLFEGGQLQLGAAFDDHNADAKPVVATGLVPTRDGLRWTRS
jgi:halogenation protein CepH